MRKLGIISLALVLALGTMGAAFALWSDTLFLDVTVNTGNIGLEWTNDLPPYDDEAADKDVSLAQLVLRWTLQKPGITCLLAGARNEKQLVENAGALEFELSQEDMEFINESIEKLELNLELK